MTPWQIDVHTGGNDQVRSHIQGSTPVRLMVSLGDGSTDSVDLAFDQIAHMPAVSEVTVKGGAGNDDIRVSYGFAPVPPGGSVPSSDASITTNIDGGMGTDKISAYYSFAPLNEPATRTSTDTRFGIPLWTNVTGGTRGNTIDVIFASADSTGGVIDFLAPANVNVMGGRSTDNILVQFLSTRSSELPGPLLALNSLFTLRLDGGDGDDRIGGPILCLAEPGLRRCPGTGRGRQGFSDARYLRPRGPDSSGADRRRRRLRYRGGNTQCDGPEL